MSTKGQKRITVKQPPKDERKQFFAAAYVIEGGKIKIRSLMGTRSGSERHECPIESREQAREEATKYLSGVRGGHTWPVEGVLIFESVEVIKPKKVEVEIEQIDIKAV